MANPQDKNRNLVLWAVAAIIVLALIGWWAGWFGGGKAPVAETPAPATTTEQPASGGTSTTTTEPATGSGTSTTTTEPAAGGTGTTTTEPAAGGTGTTTTEPAAGGGTGTTTTQP